MLDRDKRQGPGIRHERRPFNSMFVNYMLYFCFLAVSVCSGKLADIVPGIASTDQGRVGMPIEGKKKLSQLSIRKPVVCNFLRDQISGHPDDLSIITLTAS